LNKTEARPYLAEAIGTFVLTFAGSSALAFDRMGAPLGVFGVAFAHGLALMVMVYALGHISGTHINPAITISMVATRQMPWVKGAGYIAAQIVGAILAGALLRYLFADFVTATHLGTTQLQEGFNAGRGLVAEIVTTALLAAVIFGTAVHKKAVPGFAGIAIGLTLALSILAMGPVSNGSLNPARTFGPSLMANFWDDQWIYWVGPILGALIGAMGYTLLLGKGDD
jgi:MIP family channel proteins